MVLYDKKNHTKWSSFRRQIPLLMPSSSSNILIPFIVIIQAFHATRSCPLFQIYFVFFFSNQIIIQLINPIPEYEILIIRRIFV